MPVDFSPILTTLNTAGIQVKQPAIYQAISALIKFARESQAVLESQIAAVDAEIEIINGGGTGVVGFKWSWTSIDNTDFKALPTTYITLVPSPGAGKVLVPLWAFVRIETTGAYTNITAGSQAGLTISYGDWETDAFNFSPPNWDGGTIWFSLQPIHQVPDAAAILYPPSGSTPSGYPDHSVLYNVDNKAFKLVAWNDAGDFTGGNAANYAKVGVAYLVLNASTGTFV